MITIYDAATTRPDPGNPAQFIRDPFPGDVIPGNRIHSIAQKIMSFFPEPNLAGTITGANNRFVSFPSRNPVQAFHVKVDRHFGAQNTLFVRVSYTDAQRQLNSPIPADSPANPVNARDQDGYGVAIGDSHSFRSNLSEFINAFNTPHFGEPNQSAGSPAFGTITSTLAPNRSIRFALRIMF